MLYVVRTPPILAQKGDETELLRRLIGEYYVDSLVDGMVFWYQEDASVQSQRVKNWFRFISMSCAMR
jgi:hypothetical protein